MLNRFVLKELEQEISQPEIDILLGPRQVGKTTLLKTLEEWVCKKGYRTSFYDLEQPQVTAEFNRSDAEIVEKIKNSGDVVFIDEFQYIAHASKILKAVYDSGAKVKLFCSGSSSLEIHKHLKESLAGRRMLFQIYPLEYAEMTIHFHEFPLGQYLIYGGMPGLTHASSEARKQKILTELLSAYILKDVKSLVKEENIRAFNHLLYLLAQNQGSLLSVHALADEVKMSSKGVNRYLDILEQTFTCFRIYSFSNNLGNELKKSCKAYLYDLGIRNAILRDFSGVQGRSDKGVLHETFVFLKLQSLMKPNREIKFWRTKEGDEVDFILLENRKPIPIEVKSHLPHLKIPGGMRRFLLRYPQVKKAFVVNESQTGVLEYEGCEIRFLTFENFGEEKVEL
ncbi:MAG: ATP-binding protein [Chlamydiae bacterium]|nr:ATP-binding protein [Chlamydiota bacterium]